MRRWNGWGDNAITYPVPASAISFLDHLVGTGQQPKDMSLQEVIAHLPKSRLSKQSLVSTDPLTRLLHARGQSFPNWLDLRTGQINSFPDGVAYPMSNEDVVKLIQFASKTGIRIIPYGGGTRGAGNTGAI